ncbi:hypothetical protein [Rhizosphaericola mali]|uniref:Uncharacterized protein n=1 Tax=Rhizosphaericola mali TaxID=2545455 RepID=A0A5P2G0P0_9BACT|nr:hypothetical protein [Rhizosphaericola mali]QES89374.1 hypothetical protein E0W69_012105 [Rhizosphaericola mali]
MQTYIAQYRENNIDVDSIGHDNPIYKVINKGEAQEKINMNSDLKEANDVWIKILTHDPYIQMTYMLALKMIK